MRQININDETHKMLKHFSADTGQSMSIIAEAAIIQYIAEAQNTEKNNLPRK